MLECYRGPSIPASRAYTYTKPVGKRWDETFFHHPLEIPFFFGFTASGFTTLVVLSCRIPLSNIDEDPQDEVGLTALGWCTSVNRQRWDHQSCNAKFITTITTITIDIYRLLFFFFCYMVMFINIVFFLDLW